MMLQDMAVMPEKENWATLAKRLLGSLGLLLPLWGSVVVLWFVVRYFVSILVLQSS